MLGKRKKQEDISYYLADDYDYSDPDQPALLEEMEQPTRRGLPWKLILLSLFLLYVFVLLLGFFSTPYITDEDGKRQPKVMSVRMREERAYFDRLQSELKGITDILSDIRPLDDQLAKINEESRFLLATEYQALLDTIEPRIPLAKGASVPAKYEPLKKQIIDIYEDVSIYLQKVGSSITNKLPEQMDEAVSWRNKLISDFDLFSGNMYQFGLYVYVDQEQPIPNPLTAERATKPNPTTKPSPSPAATDKGQDKETEGGKTEPPKSGSKQNPKDDRDVLKPRDTVPIIIDEDSGRERWGD